MNIILLLSACYSVYSPTKISGDWTVSEILVPSEHSDLNPDAFQGKTFQFSFGDTPSYDDYDTGDSSDESGWTDYYAKENASDLWTICDSDHEGPYIYCIIPPLLIYKDEWLSEATKDLEKYSEEGCNIEPFAHDAHGYVVSENEIWFSEGFQIACFNPEETYYASYNSHWTR